MWEKAVLLYAGEKIKGQSALGKDGELAYRQGQNVAWADTSGGYLGGVGGVEGVSREGMMERLVEGIALRRTGVLEDVAGVVGFLASRDADHVTGQDVGCGWGEVLLIDLRQGWGFLFWCVFQTLSNFAMAWAARSW
ncbi:hypothetical protein B0H67DRAFT_255097 [Lasiosphaeris hirsuta]|uniref:Uncharacterized protein n=1 Tax=Lasiosphaeris hirsuta TaxID=260670 RepID=A0AA40AHJ0_9PEZI|nr:hypothetical protein B0H67DRAFT_255097 [Lasiosphaeris hirsuta]